MLDPLAKNGEILAREISGAQLVALPAAHLSNVECPRAFLPALFSFLRPATIDGEEVLASAPPPASENVTGQENYMLSRVHAPGITLGRSRPALRTDKKRVPLACDLSLSPQT